MVHVFFYKFSGDCDHDGLKNFEYSEAVKKAGLLYDIEKALTVKKHENGKPYFVYENCMEMPKAYLSISHSRNILVLALSDMNTGIDIEYVGKKHDGVIKRCFSDSEKNYISEAEEETGQNERYYEVWTKKEACVKYLGTGIDRSFKKTDVFAGNLAGMLKTFRYEAFAVSVRLSLPDDIIRTYSLEEKKSVF